MLSYGHMDLTNNVEKVTNHRNINILINDIENKRRPKICTGRGKSGFTLVCMENTMINK